MIQTPTTILNKTPYNNITTHFKLFSSSFPSQPKKSLSFSLTPLHFTLISPSLSLSFRQSSNLFTSFSTTNLVGPFGFKGGIMGLGYSPLSAGEIGGVGGSPPGGSGGSGGSDGGENGGEENSKWNIVSWYQDLLAKYPVLTKAVTSALLTFIGDLICQLVIDKVPSLNYKRIFIFTFLGFSLVGPTLHYWYLYLSKLVTLPGASGAFLRLLLDQFLFAPAFIGVFLSALVALEGRPSEVVPKLKQEWFSSVLANWKLWIPFQFLNFRFVPQQLQVLASNFVALVWNVILSYKAHKEVVSK